MAREVDSFSLWIAAPVMACTCVALLAVVYVSIAEVRRMERAPCAHATAPDCERPSPDVMTCPCPRDAGVR